MSDETNKKWLGNSKSAQEVIKEEKNYIKKAKGKKSDDKYEFWGLAISGGGIRSASFGLGVMQALVSTTPKDPSTSHGPTRGSATSRAKRR